ncbi:sigma factor-like helix-turn-helix DNA-binding protein [Peribacillus frigoritolerans]|uniref:sigma factor-like helix-turn-helix DNA-binding protein n=1 Tax=Peribacillus frigoritolerans TaxID=450367 RepID=UPI003F7CDD32
MPSAFLHHPYGMYALLEMEGLTLKSIHKLANDNFTLYDFKVENEKVISLNKSKPTLVKKIKERLPLVNEEQFNITMFKLASKGISARNIDTLRGLGFNYTDIPNLTAQRLTELTGVSKNAMFKKIQEAFELVEESLRNNFSNLSYTCELKVIFDKLAPKDFLTLGDLKEKISKHFNIQIHEVDENEILNFLRENSKKNFICVEGMSFTKKYLKVEEYLENDFKNKDIQKDILIARMNYMTLQDIGDVFDLTRERIRQIEKKVINNLPDIEEVLYYEQIFTEYEWEENLFIDVFGESQKVYRFINLVLKKGKKRLIDNLELLKLKSSQKQKVAKYYNFFINYENKLVSYTKLDFFEHYMFKYGQENIKDCEFVEKANNSIFESDLEDANLLFDIYSVRGLGERSSKVVRGRSNSFRFYNLGSLEGNTLNKLRELLDLPTGIYSMKKIYRENKEFMEEIGIQSAYELHNLYKKKIMLGKVQYTRMPEFSIGEITKDEFLKGLFYEQAPIMLDDFTQYVEENYGLKQTSLRSLIQTEYINYLDGYQIRVDYLPITSDEIEQLRNLLTKDIYMIDEITQMGKLIDEKFHDKFLNNHTLLQVDYHIKGQFVLKRKYQSIERFFINFILKDDYFVNHRTGIYRSQSFSKALYDLEKSLEIVKVEKDMYITAQKLESAGVSKDDLLDFRNQAMLLAPEDEYFTLHTLRKRGLTHELDDFGFDDVFYDRIIRTDPRVKSIRLAIGSIFLKTDLDISFIGFIQSIVEKNESINLYELEDYIKVKFNLQINLGKVISLSKETSMYYSEELNKLYIDKETFYEEIY